MTSGPEMLAFLQGIADIFTLSFRIPFAIPATSDIVNPTGIRHNVCSLVGTEFLESIVLPSNLAFRTMGLSVLVPEFSVPPRSQFHIQ
jgi:hypothetical protein